MDGAAEMAKAINQQVKGWERLGHPCLVERFVLKNGCYMTPDPDHGFEMGTPKECFTNAGLMALQGLGLTYVEGFAVRPKLGMLLHHAWLTDDESRAIDVTWEDTAGCHYFGVPFFRTTLREEIGRTGYWGLLDNGKGVNIDFMRRFDPAFEIPEMVRHLFTETA